MSIRSFLAFMLVIALVALAISFAFSDFFPWNNASFSASIPLQSTNIQIPFQVQTFGNAWDGQIVFGLWNMSPTPFAAQIYNSYLVVMKTNGTIQYLRQAPDQSYLNAKNVGLNTIMFQGEPNLVTNFWDFASNVSVSYPNVYGHHDVVYNPVDSTFLTLRNYVSTVNQNQILFDQIVKLDLSGNILWSWDTATHIPLSEADPFNLTTFFENQTVIDFTHANALDWDYANNVVYFNVRHTNTFYKINMTDGNIIWACGQFGNFTLLDENGNQTNSLWYHSHSTKRIAPNVFIMFDNDYDNVTNTGDCRSRMIELTIDEQNMTAKVTWSWESPSQYWTPYFGKTDRLPNGDHIAVFGSPTHQFSQNKPWVGNDTGAAIVEVNQQGQMVRTWTFPPGWGIYRIDEITNQNPFTFPSPTPNPSPTGIQTSSQVPTATATLTPNPTSAPTSNSPSNLPSSTIPQTASPTSSASTPSSSVSPSFSATPSSSSFAPTPTPNNSGLSLTSMIFIFIVIIGVIGILAAIFYRKKLVKPKM